MSNDIVCNLSFGLVGDGFDMVGDKLGSEVVADELDGFVLSLRILDGEFVILSLFAKSVDRGNCEYFRKFFKHNVSHNYLSFKLQNKWNRRMSSFEI